MLKRLWNGCMNLYMNASGAPLEWRSAIIVPLFKGNSDKKECKNYRSISLFSTDGKVYGKVIIERVK
jgi:hypothetical protein